MTNHPYLRGAIGLAALALLSSPALAQFAGGYPSCLGAMDGADDGGGFGFTTAVLRWDQASRLALVATGAPDGAGGRGSVTVWNADPAGNFGEVVAELVGDNVGDHFGASLAVGPDVNRDGTADLLVGAPGGPGSSGYVRIFSGDERAGFPILREHFGSLPGLSFGGNVELVGDVDDDTVLDYFIYASGNGGGTVGHIDVISGASGSTLYGITGMANDFLGLGGASLGDIDADNHDDFAVGSPGENFGAGAVHWYSGRTAQLLRTLWGAPREELGGRMTSVPGSRVLYVAGVNEYFGGAGAVHRVDLTTGQITHTVRGTPGDRLGRSLAFVNFDGRGSDELCVGRPGSSEVRVYDADTLSLRGVMATRASMQFAVSMCRADYDHLIVGSPAATDANGRPRGKAGLFHVANDPLQADQYRIDSTTGGSVELTLVLRPQFAGSTYLLAATASGTRPGFPFGGIANVPLNVDALTLAGLGGGLFVNGIGQVGTGGSVPGPIRVSLPAVPGASLSLHLALLLYSPQGGWHYASNPMPLVYRP